MNKPQLLTFDLDNTLWAVDPVIVRAERLMRDYLSQQVPEFEARFDRDAMWQIRQQLVESNPDIRHDLSITRELTLRQAISQCGYSNAQAEQLAAQAFAIFIDARHDVEFFDGVEPVLQQLQTDYQLYALTNGNADVRRLSIGQFFSGFHSSASAKASKPEPQIFHAALSQAQLPPHQAVHIGDNWVDDIQGATAVGMPSIWVNFDAKPQPAADHLGAPVQQVNHLWEIPQAIKDLAAKL